MNYSFLDQLLDVVSAFFLFDFEFTLERGSSIWDCFGIKDLPIWCSRFGGGGRSAIVVFEPPLQVVSGAHIILVGFQAKKDVDGVYSRLKK